MPQFIKHVGQVDATGKKCVVVFREVPGEENSCLVVETESLPQQYHDDLMTAVESDSAQEDMDFFKFASRSTFHDGRNMLEAMHLSGWLRKISSGDVTMLPTREVSIKLKELNQQIANLNPNAGRTTSGDISATETVAESKPAGVLDDSQLANQMRSQAAYFQKEAQRLLAEAEALNPVGAVTPVAEVRPKRKYTKKK
jgi:hypothetical protein